MSVKPANTSQRITDELRSDKASSRRQPLGESESEHLVQFYESDAYLVEMLADFIETGLLAEETCLLFATSEHLAQLEHHLQIRKRDLTSSSARGAYHIFELPPVS